MWKCAKCGADVDYGDAFCRKCGAPFGLVETQDDAPQADVWKCSACGAVVSRSDRRCPSCRVRLEFEDDPSERFRCSECGRQVTRSNRRCPGCGSRLFFEDESAPASVRQPGTGVDGWRVASLILVSLVALMSVVYDPPRNDYWPQAVLLSAAFQPLAWLGVVFAFIAQRRGARGTVWAALLIWAGGALLGAIIAASY
jgi:DNA-directed RNA polymerase subunit RPC12/RpoP